MFHRLWTLIRKELQSLLREPQTRAKPRSERKKKESERNI